MFLWGRDVKKTCQLQCFHSKYLQGKQSFPRTVEGELAGDEQLFFERCHCLVLLWRVTVISQSLPSWLKFWWVYVGWATPCDERLSPGDVYCMRSKRPQTTFGPPRGSRWYHCCSEMPVTDAGTFPQSISRGSCQHRVPSCFITFFLAVSFFTRFCSSINRILFLSFEVELFSSIRLFQRLSFPSLGG